MNCAFRFADSAPVLSNHADFLSTQTCILDSHAEEHVFAVLVAGGKGILVEQHQFRVIRARFCELGEFPSDGGDQGGRCVRSSLVMVLRE